VSGTSHFLTQEKSDLCNKTIVEFLTTDTVDIAAPIRRA
jgi:hypothetical protein